MPHFVYPLRDNNATSNDQRVGSCTSIGGRDICRFFRCLAGGCEDGVGADGGERAGGEAPIRVDGVPERVCKSLRWSARTSSLFCLRGKSCQTALKFLSRQMSLKECAATVLSSIHLLYKLCVKEEFLSLLLLLFPHHVWVVKTLKST